MIIKLAHTYHYAVQKKMYVCRTNLLPLLVYGAASSGLLGNTQNNVRVVGVETSN